MSDSQQPVSSSPFVRQWEDTRSEVLNAVEAVGESGCRASWMPPLAYMGQRLSIELLLYLLLYLLALILGLAVAARQRAGHEVLAS